LKNISTSVIKIVVSKHTIALIYIQQLFTPSAFNPMV